MATIKRRGKKYNVIYYYEDKGERKQKWESFDSFEKAKKRKVEIESDQDKGIFVNPTDMTVTEFMDVFVDIYGKTEWGLTTFGKNVALIRNYIVPYIGDYKVQAINSLSIERYYSLLRKSENKMSVKNGYKKELVSESTIQRVHMLLKTAFKQGVLWGIVGQNPLDKVRKPKYEKQKRDIWTSEQIATLLRECTDPKLALSVHLAFACSLRVGEILGLTWDCMHISDEEIEDDNAYVYVEKELVYIEKSSIDALNGKGVIKVFPADENVKHVFVLKSPKTASSVRKVWIPNQLALLLRDWEKRQQEYKNFLQEEYNDHNLVICLEDGRPCSKSVIENAFYKYTDSLGLPRVVFHSLRHSSTTYKLKLNKGDIKATQGDTGHSQADMVMEVYSHILDEDRKVNAQRFNESFYKKGGDIERKNKKIDIDALITKLKNDPEALQKVADLLKKK